MRTARLPRARRPRKRQRCTARQRLPEAVALIPLPSPPTHPCTGPMLPEVTRDYWQGRGAMLHELPEEILRAIMSRLVCNDAVKLASLHTTLRRILRTLPSLEPSVVLDMTSLPGFNGMGGGGAAAMQTRQRRSNSFAAFTAAHPGTAINAVTLRLALTGQVPVYISDGIEFAVDWLPLRSLKRLRIETNLPARAREVRTGMMARLEAHALRPT